MEFIYEILYSYGINVNQIEQITPNVFRIEDGEKVYALKKSALTQNNVSNWEQVFHESHNNEINHILPVYMTKDHLLFNKHNNNIYYLSPWVYEQGNKSIEKLYQSIGLIHSKTKYNHLVNNETLIQKFTNYLTACEQTEENLLSFVDQFEAKHYMAPVELQVCTHFRDLEFAIKILKKRVEDFIRYEQEKKEEWSFSLCHGQLNNDHFLTTLNDHYFINWEKASYNYPIFDLVNYLKDESQKYHSPTKDMIKYFPKYMDENELTKSELNLMLIYLLDPAAYIVQVDKYISQNTESMIILTKALQKQYRIICFGIELSTFIENEYERFSFNDTNEGQSHSK